MKVVGVDEFGGPEALRVFELPERHAGPGEVRIRVHAAAVNPTDTYIRNGARAEQQKATPPPYVPGMDAAGVLDEIGDGVATDLAVGDRVMAIVLPKGSHGGYATVPRAAGRVGRRRAGRLQRRRGLDAADERPHRPPGARPAGPAARRRRWR